MATTELTRLAQCLIAKLLVSADKGATRAEIKKALDPMLAHRLSGSALNERIETVIDELRSQGLIDRHRKGKTDKSIITTSGIDRALEILGLAELPPKAKWDQVKKTWLAALALGMPPPSGDGVKRFAGEPGFKAALARIEFNLPIAADAKLDEALAALSWKLLDFEPGAKFTVKAVQSALIQRALDQPIRVDAKSDPKKEATKLLGQRLNARQAGRDELRSAALRRWIDADSTPPGKPTQTPTREESKQATALPLAQPHTYEPMPLPHFASSVLDAARECPSGRFGSNRVFISHVWHHLHNQAEFAGMDVVAFKKRLIEAQNARLIDLSRADLVEAMDPIDVRRSEVLHFGASFHFIRC